MPKINKVLAIGGLAAAMLAIVGSQAIADPPSGTTPRKVDIIGTGSDTTQLAMDKITAKYDASKPAPTNKWYSFDAVGSATIKEKTGCTAENRPVGSGAGIADLEANLHPNGDPTGYCVDFARSSRGRASTDPQSIVFLPFAYDAVTWSADTFSGSTNAPSNLTTLQLQAIYSCDASLLNSSESGPVTWNEVGGTSTDAVVPVIPQSSSGTRSFFLSKIGVTTLGACVQGQTKNNVVENEGTNAIFKKSATSADIVFPYSVAVYLAQTVHNHGAGTQGHQVLRSVNHTKPTTVSNGSTEIRVSFPYLREVYNVVRNANKNLTTLDVPKYLKPYFGTGAAGTGYMCSAAAEKIATNFGFRSMPSTRCGVPQ